MLTNEWTERLCYISVGDINPPLHVTDSGSLSPPKKNWPDPDL